MKFNDEQIKAIKHTKGPMLVLAGPGSGKTTVITERIKNLIHNYKVNPSNILVITFNKAAANEMKNRFYSSNPNHADNVSFGTFHSVFYKIIKFSYNYNNNSVLSELEKRNIFKIIITKYDYDIDIEDEEEFITDIINEISFIKNNMIDLNQYKPKVCNLNLFKRIYKEYTQAVNKANKIDFDDMLIICYELLKQREDILKVWQNKYQYILVDEMQDINKVQYEVIRMLGGKSANIFMVGDDDQSIYGFRGSDPKIMLGFFDDYKDAYKINLTKNYRSTDNIIEVSKKLIDNNTKRFKKRVQINNLIGSKPEILIFDNFYEEDKMVVSKITKYLHEGYDYKDIAILYRTSIDVRHLIGKLMEYNIPFKIKDTVPNMYEHWAVANILTYIKIALGDNIKANYLKIINKPKRYISRDAFCDMRVDLNSLIEYYKEKDYVVERIEKLHYDLLLIKKLNPFAAFNFIRNSVGYDDYIKEYAADKNIKAEDIFSIIDEVAESLKGLKTHEMMFEKIEEYSKELKDNKETYAYDDNSDRVVLSTMHSSKGLEYRAVIIIDANEGIIPHSKAVKDEDVEEERRLFYVAMTRAKEHLHIFAVKERLNKKLKISRYIKEIVLN